MSPKKTNKILVIEDDETIATMYKTKFESDGLKVFSANTGLEGLKIATQEKPDIIMLDIILPQLDGFSVLKKLKSSQETKNIPVIMLTNLGTEEDMAKGKAMGAKDYLVKANLTPMQISHKVKIYLQAKSVKSKK